MLQFGLEALSSLSHIVDVFAVALRAACGRTPREATVVAQKLVDRSMVGHGDTAGVALKRKTAVPAQQECRVASAVEQNHRLLTTPQTRTHCLKQTLGENDLLAF